MSNIKLKQNAAQARRDANWNTFLIRTFAPLAIPSVMSILTALGVVHFVPTVIVTIAAGLFIVANFVAYATRNMKRKEEA